MTKHFTVKTEQGKLDSLKEPVRIAFSITPVEADKATHPYDPIAMRVTSFSANGQESVEVPWSSNSVYFCTYNHNGRKTQYQNIANPMQMPGHAITLISPATWSAPVSCNDQVSFVATNKSGSVANILVYLGWQYFAYRPLSNGCSIHVPSTFQLQAYVVSNAITDLTILQLEDLTRPIFTSPINCNVLPDLSTWTLCQDDKGMFRIKNDAFPGLGYPPPPAKTVAESSSKRDPLSEVLERLAMIETSIAHMQDDIDQGKRAIVELRDQSLTKEEARKSDTMISNRMSDFGRTIINMEVKTTRLAESFDKNQDRLSLVHRAVTDTQHLLAGMEQTSNDFNRRLPILESKAEKTYDRLSILAESAGRTQNQVTAVEKAIHQTQDHVSVVQQLVVASNAQLSMMKQTPGMTITPEPVTPSGKLVEGGMEGSGMGVRVEKLEKSAQEQRKAIRAVERRLPKLETDLGAVKGSIDGLDRRLNALETRSDDGEAGIDDEASSSVEGSPVMFPNHLVGGPPAA